MQWAYCANSRAFIPVERPLNSSRPSFGVHHSSPTKTRTTALSLHRKCLRQKSSSTTRAPMTVTATAAQELKTTRVMFKNSAGENLVGILTDTSSPDTIILCHGYMDHKDAFHFPRFASEMAERGLSTLRFDFAGNGESEGTFDFCAYAKEVEDIRCAVEFLRSQGKTVIALVGHSKGAAEVLLYAAKYDDVPRVVNISGRFNMVQGITQRFGDTVFARLRRGGAIEIPSKGFTWKLTEQSVLERINTDMAAAAKAIRTTRVLTLHGSADATIPVEDAHEFDKLIANHTLRVVQGANHNYTQREHADYMICVVLDFVTATS